MIAEDPLVFAGPATDSLVGIDPVSGQNWRPDGIHFGEAGLNEHAARWAAAIAATGLIPEFDLGDFNSDSAVNAEDGQSERRP